VCKVSGGTQMRVRFPINAERWDPCAEAVVVEALVDEDDGALRVVRFEIGADLLTPLALVAASHSNPLSEFQCCRLVSEGLVRAAASRAGRQWVM